MAGTSKATSVADEGVDEALAALGGAVARATGGTGGLDLSEDAHDGAIGRMERMATEAVLRDRSLVWDARDFLIDQIKSRPKPWSATSNAEQRDVAAACEHAAKELVRKVVEAVAANGKEPVRVLLTKVTLGDDIVIAGKVKTLGEDEQDKAVMQLHHARGKHVLLTVASVSDYDDNQTEAATDPDEPALQFEAGSDDADLAGEGSATHRVYDPEAQEYLSQDEESWVEREDAAGAWDVTRATELAGDYDAETRALVDAA